MKSAMQRWTVILTMGACVMVVGCRKAPPDAMHGGETQEKLQVGDIGERAAHDEGSERVQKDVQEMPDDGLHNHAAKQDVADENDAPAAPPSDEAKTQDTARGVAWSVPERWPLVSEESEFRVRTWRLPAVSMAGAGECALYRFTGGGDPQENLQRWMGEFRGADGSVESVEAAQAERTIQGAPAWLVRAEGQYVSQTPGVEDSEKTFDDYALFGAVIVAEGDPVFAKCVGPVEVIGYEANSILGWMDSMKVSEN